MLDLRTTMKFHHCKFFSLFTTQIELRITMPWHEPIKALFYGQKFERPVSQPLAGLCLPHMKLPTADSPVWLHRPYIPTWNISFLAVLSNYNSNQVNGFETPSVISTGQSVLLFYSLKEETVDKGGLADNNGWPQHSHPHNLLKERQWHMRPPLAHNAKVVSDSFFSQTTRPSHPNPYLDMFPQLARCGDDVSRTYWSIFSHFHVSGILYYWRFILKAREQFCFFVLRKRISFSMLADSEKS